jgi:hypothetical protein
MSPSLGFLEEDQGDSLTGDFVWGLKIIYRNGAARPFFIIMTISLNG